MTTGRRRGAGRRILAGSAAGAGMAAAVAMGHSPVAAPERPPTFPAPAIAAVAADTASEPARPLALHIPRIGVTSELVPLVVDGDGVLQPPASADVAGWHAAGTVPGEVGPAVIAGHVDTRSGPGVFHALASLDPGDEVQVSRSDGSVVTFRVLSTETVGKDEFPTERVYGPTPVAELRLITCGGDFDRQTRHYPENVVIRAVRD